mgnify:CR=1 FL=1
MKSLLPLIKDFEKHREGLSSVYKEESGKLRISDDKVLEVTRSTQHKH